MWSTPMFYSEFFAQPIQFNLHLFAKHLSAPRICLTLFQALGRQWYAKETKSFFSWSLHPSCGQTDNKQTNKCWVLISAKKKNKVWVRVWVYWVIREGLSDKMSRDSESVFQAVETAGAKVLSWEWALHIVEPWGGQSSWSGWARGMGRNLDLEVSDRSQII